MKKLSLFLSISVFAALLVACGETNDDEVEAALTSENVEESSENESQERSESESQDVSSDGVEWRIKEVVEYDFGTLHVIRSSELEGDSKYFRTDRGPTVTYNFTNTQVGILEPNEGDEELFVYRDEEFLYYDLDELFVVVIDFEVENHSEESVTLTEPYGGRALARYYSDLITEYSHDISGEFSPGEVKNGRKLYNLYAPPTEMVEKDFFELNFHTSKIEDADGNEKDDYVQNISLSGRIVD